MLEDVVGGILAMTSLSSLYLSYVELNKRFGRIISIILSVPIAILMTIIVGCIIWFIGSTFF